jgi:hypothetical protein
MLSLTGIYMFFIPILKRRRRKWKSYYIYYYSHL